MEFPRQLPALGFQTVAILSGKLQLMETTGSSPYGHRHNASLVDLYFDFWQPISTYILDLTFANGTTQTGAARPRLPSM